MRDISRAVNGQQDDPKTWAQGSIHPAGWDLAEVRGCFIDGCWMSWTGSSTPACLPARPCAADTKPEAIKPRTKRRLIRVQIFCTQIICMTPMNTTPTTICDDVLVNLRKIIRAMDLHSSKLRREHDLTSPQLVVLREIVRHERMNMGALAKLVSLSSATVTGIVDRLEERGLVARSRTGTDRRQILMASTPAGQQVMAQAPTLFQERFVQGLNNLRQWEQAQILSSLARLVEMMERDGLPQVAPPPPPLPERGVAEAPDGFLASCQMLLDGRPLSDAAVEASSPPSGISMTLVRTPEALPPDLSLEGLTDFLHTAMHPYEDTPEDIRRGLDYALGISASPGGFILLAREANVLLGALVMLNTGMSGYIPENLLLFLAVIPARRDQGLGAKLVREAQHQCRGRIKLHVEYENPARRLYTRLGFTSKYAEMRWPP